MDKTKQRRGAEADRTLERAEKAERNSRILEADLEKTRNKLKTSEAASQHHKRHIHHLEQDLDAMKLKYEGVVKKHKASQAEHDSLVRHLKSLIQHS